MSTQNNWPGSSGSVTESPATVVQAHPVAPATRRCTSRSTTPPAWPSNREVSCGKHVEILTDEQKATTVGFLARALGWFSEQGITCRRVLSDNEFSYRSDEWRKARSALDIKPIRTKPYTPQANGKAERFIKTLLAEWA